MKSEFAIKIQLTLSKLIGSIVALTGCYGFVAKIDSAQSVFLVGLGLAAIGLKQYFISKLPTVIPNEERK